MTAAGLSLLAKRRFLPLFATQFLGAFNDNLYRSAMLFAITFEIMAGTPERAAQATVISGGVFILPYFLFSSIAGQLADRVDKARLAQAVKIAEIPIMLAGAGGLLMGSVPVLFASLFAMGTHSTFFGPVKYSILPQHLARTELMGGTALVEAGTFVAILLGQLAGALMSAGDAAVAVLTMAGLGLAFSFFIPPAPPHAEGPRTDFNLFRATAAIVCGARTTKGLFSTILGISWFFALGAILTQQFAPLVERLNAGAGVAALFLAVFSVGVAIGSLVVGRLQGSRISARYVPVSALALAIAVIDLSVTSGTLVPAAAPVGVGGFIKLAGSWRLIADLLVISVAGGIFIVPLYALLQTLGEPSNRSRDIAANNVVNAAVMVGLSLLVTATLAAGAGVSTVFLLLGVLGVVAAAAAAGLKHGDKAG